MFEKTQRIGLIVYLYYNRDRKKIDSYGDVLYHSKKHRYVHLYLEQDRVEEVSKQLQSEKFVKKVKFSPLKELGTNFVGILYQDPS